MTALQILKVISILLYFSLVLAEKNNEKDFTINFHQNDYQMKIERAEVVSYNKKYTEAKLKTFKYNRTCTAFNFTMDCKVEMGNEIEIVVQAYRFASNEYRLFPMRFEINACDSLSKNFLGFSKFDTCGNFAGCPLKKGQLEICNFTPDGTYLPPLIPSGKYMWEMDCLYLSDQLMLLRVYLEILRPFV